MALRKTTSRGRPKIAPNVKTTKTKKFKKTDKLPQIPKRNRVFKEPESIHGLRELFTTNEIAHLFGVTHAAVQHWGIIPVGKKGRTNLYNLRDVLEHRFGSDNEQIDERKEKARLAKYNAESAKLDLAVKEGKLVEISKSRKALDEFASVVKAAVLSIPTKISPQLDQVSARVAHKLLTKECRGVLAEASELISAIAKTA